jgi:hypothetical protein
MNRLALPAIAWGPRNLCGAPSMFAVSNALVRRLTCHPDAHGFTAMKEAITRRYLALAIEPIHIGAQRAASVSGTARDVDGFPFIPASSLKGTVRSLCSMTMGVDGCDGKGWHCPQPHRCPSCSVFGFANYQGPTASSLVRFSSGNLVLVPIQTDVGTFWVTSSFRLQQSQIVSPYTLPDPPRVALAE